MSFTLWFLCFIPPLPRRGCLYTHSGVCYIVTAHQAIHCATELESLNLYSHYGWGLNYLLAVRDTLGDRYDHFFETRLEFLFPDFFAFWNNLNITTIAGQLGLSILLDVVMLGLQMLPDWGCIGRGRNKVGDPNGSP